MMVYSPAGDELTWATGVNQMGRYEFIYKVYEADELIPSHDPFTFQPNGSFRRSFSRVFGKGCSQGSG
jgi:hypothetical protein